MLRVSRETAPMKLFEFGVDSIIVGDRDSTALAMADRCQVHGPPNVMFSHRRVTWPGGHQTIVIAACDIGLVRGRTVGAIWIGNIDLPTRELWDALMLGLLLEPREVMLTGMTSIMTCKEIDW